MLGITYVLQQQQRLCALQKHQPHTLHLVDSKLASDRLMPAVQVVRGVTPQRPLL